jgi:hypothetical protein
MELLSLDCFYIRSGFVLVAELYLHKHDTLSLIVNGYSMAARKIGVFNIIVNSINNMILIDVIGDTV